MAQSMQSRNNSKSTKINLPNKQQRQPVGLALLFCRTTNDNKKAESAAYKKQTADSAY